MRIWSGRLPIYISHDCASLLHFGTYLVNLSAEHLKEWLDIVQRLGVNKLSIMIPKARP